MLQTDPPCLLNYVFFPTWPQPVQISTPNGAANAVINVSVSNPKKVYCNKIEIYIPVGSTPDALTPDAPGVAPSTSRWSGGKSQVRGDKPKLVGEQFTRYTYNCNQKGDYGIGYALAFSIAVSPVSSSAGDCTVWISEYSSAEDDPAKFVRRSSSFTVQKAQPQFYLTNFIASSPSADKDQRVPAGEFKKREKIQLSWEGNGSTYTVYTAGGAKTLYSGPDTSFPLDNGLEDTTTFILQAEVAGADKGGGTSFQTVYLYQSLTVKILDAVITPSSVTTSSLTTTSLQTSSLTVTDDEAEVSLPGGLSVAKGVRIQDTLTITSQKGGPLRVTGPIDDAGSGIEFRHSNGSQGIGFTYNTIYATGSNADQDLILAPRGAGRLIVKGARQLVGSRKIWAGKVGYGQGWANLGIDKLYGLGGPPTQVGAKREYRLYLISWDQWSGDGAGTLVRLQFAGSGSQQDVQFPPIWGSPSFTDYRGQAYSGFFGVNQPPPAENGWISGISVNSVTGNATPDAQLYELWVEFWDVFD